MRKKIMRKNTQNIVTTNKVAKCAKNDVKNLSPFWYIKQLNALGKRNEFCENTNIAELGKRVKALHGGNGYFIADVFTKDYKGRFCTLQATTESGTMFESESKDGFAYRTHIDNKGREIIDGFLLVPVSLSLAGFIDGFKKIVTAEEKRVKDERRAADKAAKDADKAAKMFKAVEAVFGELALTFTPDEIADKYAKIKAAA